MRNAPTIRSVTELAASRSDALTPASFTSFGDLLRFLRRRARLTQRELSVAVGYNFAQISRLEAGQRLPDPTVIAAVFVAALDLEQEPAWATRLIQLAEDARHQAAPVAQRDAPAATLPSGTITFLFTEIADSTGLWGQHPLAMPAALQRHEILLHQSIAKHHGVVFQTVGDAVCAAFASALDALAAAVAIQHGLQRESWGAIGALGVRMALHTGVAEPYTGAYVGLPLSRAAQLLATGHGQQVLISRATWELVHDQLPLEVELRDLGMHRLTDLARPEQIWQLVVPDLPAEFPPLRTLDARATNLPAQAAPLIGREQELAVACDLLRRVDVRLLTLVGPGGVGKTRLGLQIAAELLDDFADGVFLVALAPISHSELVAPAIARALGLAETGGQQTAERLKYALGQKQLLLVLDNFEQVAPATLLIGELLAAAPQLKVLITSRASVHLSTAHEFFVPPLGLPPVKDESRRTKDEEAQDRSTRPPSSFSVYPSVELFIERARAVKADFAVTPETAPTIAQICNRLDGLPLAIELAAAWIKYLSPEALLARLERRLPLLRGGARDLPARQQTLRSTIEWSYNLLEAVEQTLFARLAVFVGGCTLEAASEVLSFELSVMSEGPDQLRTQNSELKTLEGLAALVDKSMLRREETSTVPRFVMLETIREYALEQLEERGEVEAMRSRHLSYYLMLAEAAAPLPQLASVDLPAWLNRLEADHDNLRTALAWCLADTETPATRHETGVRQPPISPSRQELGLRLAGTLWPLWYERGYMNEGRSWLDRALAVSDGGGRTRAQALLGAGMLAWRQADYAVSRGMLEASIGLWRELGDTRHCAYAIHFLGHVRFDQRDYAGARVLFEESLRLYHALGNAAEDMEAIGCLGMLAYHEGDFVMARARFEESLTYHRSLGNQEGIALALNRLGELARLAGDDDYAAALYQESLAICRAIGRTMDVASALHKLGYVAQHRGAYARAQALFAESLALQRELGNKQGIAECLAGLAGLAAATEEHERAARLFGAADALLDAIGAPLSPADRAERDRDLALACGHLGETQFGAAWTAGRALSPDQASAAALGLAIRPCAPDVGLAQAAQIEQPAVIHHLVEPLTKRELDVLR
jgi:predicted ATPase/class 3 adenylate cyclase